MKDMKFGEERGRRWLTVNYNNKEIKYSYPPVQGRYTDCFQKINSDSELKPANGLELALLTAGAFSRKQPEWEDIKEKGIIQNYIRIPKRALWIPKKHEFAGVFLEEDSEGKGLSTKMKIPKDINGWKEQNGIYISKDKILIFIPDGKYKLENYDKDSFVRDGLAIGQLTEEGAEIFNKTAYDNQRIPRLFGLDINQISKPEQRVSALFTYYGGGLGLGAGNGGSASGFAFGVKK